MKYYYNHNYGLILYPNNWWDTFRLFLTWLLHPSFKRVWKKNSNWYKPHVAGCMEKKLIDTHYPDEAES